MSNPLALDSCPSCEQIDQCYRPACICPACKNDPRALKSWEAFAPLMRKLNGAAIHWNWGTDSLNLDGPSRHYLEINGRDIWYEVHLSQDGEFIVEKIFITKAFSEAAQIDSKIIYKGSSPVLAAVSIDFKDESC